MKQSVYRSTMHPTRIFDCVPINLLQTQIRHNLSPFPLVILFLFLWIWRAVVSTNGLRN